MAHPEVEFHPEAVREAREARRWYRERSESAAAAFASEIDLAVKRIAESPARWPIYLHGTRQYLLRRFPYVIVYREFESRIQVVAVAHGRRKPGYWKDRSSG